MQLRPRNIFGFGSFIVIIPPHLSYRSHSEVGLVCVTTTFDKYRFLQNRWHTWNICYESVILTQWSFFKEISLFASGLDLFLSLSKSLSTPLFPSSSNDSLNSLPWFLSWCRWIFIMMSLHIFLYSPSHLFLLILPFLPFLWIWRGSLSFTWYSCTSWGAYSFRVCEEYRALFFSVELRVHLEVASCYSAVKKLDVESLASRYTSWALFLVFVETVECRRQ